MRQVKSILPLPRRMGRLTDIIMTEGKSTNQNKIKPRAKDEKEKSRKKKSKNVSRKESSILDNKREWWRR